MVSYHIVHRARVMSDADAMCFKPTAYAVPTSAFADRGSRGLHDCPQTRVQGLHQKPTVSHRTCEGQKRFVCGCGCGSNNDQSKSALFEANNLQVKFPVHHGCFRLGLPQGLSVDNAVLATNTIGYYSMFTRDLTPNPAQHNLSASGLHVTILDSMSFCFVLLNSLAIEWAIKSSGVDITHV